MKINIIIFLVLICLVSCSSKKDNYVNITCPETFISTEHQNYFFTKDSLKLKNFSMEYIGTINNFRIQCQKINEDAIISSLDILFILTPLNEEIEEYNLSYFVKILDENKNILDSQLFNINGKFNLKIPLKYQSHYSILFSSLIAAITLIRCPVLSFANNGSQ